MSVANTLPARTLADILLERSADGLCLVAPDGTVLRANAEWLRSTGFTEEQVVGSNIIDLFPATRDVALAMHARARAGHHVEVPQHAQTENGRETWWEGSIDPVPMEGGTGLLISARRKAREAQRAREAWLRGQREALEAAVNDAPLETSLGALVHTATDALGQDVRAAFYLANGGGTELHHVVGMPPAYAEAVDGFKIGRESLACGLATHTGQPILTSDVKTDARWEPWRWLAARFDYRACWSFPIHSSAGKFVGSLAVYWRQSREATERDLELASFLTHTASVIISRHNESKARKRAEKANAQLVEADLHKDRFLAVLSHELRNPLAPIRNSTYILRHAAPGSEQAQRAQSVIERQTQHLTRLVDDLLDVTRITRGKIELRRERVDLREVVPRAADDFRAMMDERELAFRIAVPAARVWADVDVTRLTQVIGNLLHNAAKFTPTSGEVDLSLGAEDGSAEIRVRDTGIGIDPVLLPHIFDAFVQGERTLARREGGLGLGLAMVKGIAELHGGSVRAESAGIGKGAEVVVRLPLAPMVISGKAEVRTLRHGRTRRILVVDDNRDAAESLAEILRMLGHDVEVAFDGPTAIEKARANPPEVVLCDVGLPGMSGYEVAKTLRASTRQGVQLIAVSGYAQPEDVQLAIEAGFDGHVAKPCDPEQIERLLT